MTSSITQHSPSAGDEELTDLTLINGIGPTRQQMLRDVLSIDSIADLAALTADDIENQLKAANQTVPRSQIESWVEQAQSIIKTAAPSPSDWHAINTFSVTFEEKIDSNNVPDRRIRVRHAVSGTEQTWHGQNIRAATAWMSQFVDNDRQPAAPPVVTLNAAMQDIVDKVENRQADPSATSQPPVPAVKITQVRAFQPPDQAIPLGLTPNAQLSPGVIKGSQFFKLETEFTVSGLDKLAEAQMPHHYSAQFFVYDRTLGTVLSLGSSEVYPFTPDQPTYTVSLDNVVLRAGTYRLEIVTRLERQSGAWMGYLEVPILQVVG